MTVTSAGARARALAAARPAKPPPTIKTFGRPGIAQVQSLKSNVKRTGNRGQETGDGQETGRGRRYDVRMVTASEKGTQLLSPQLLAQLERLELVSRKVFRGRMKGERRSKRKGQSVEFA